MLQILTLIYIITLILYFSKNLNPVYKEFQIHFNQYKDKKYVNQEEIIKKHIFTIIISKIGNYIPNIYQCFILLLLLYIPIFPFLISTFWYLGKSDFVNYSSAFFLFTYLFIYYAPKGGSNESTLSYKLNGYLFIPYQIYEGDTFKISVEIMTTVIKTNNQNFNIKSNDNFEIVLPYKDNTFLEIKIMSPAIKITPDNTIKKTINTSDKIIYNWNCYFEKSGFHEINIIFNLINDQGESNIGELKKNIKVMKLLGLTSIQLTHLKFALLIFLLIWMIVAKESFKDIILAIISSL